MGMTPSPFPKPLWRQARGTDYLWQPGFDAERQLWLSGSWVVYPGMRFSEARKQHEDMYAGIRRAWGSQVPSDKPIALEDMTPGQRQAWEHYSGDAALAVRSKVTGAIGVVAVRIQAGKVVAPMSVRWIASSNYLVLPYVTHPHDSSQIVDQRPLVPARLLSERDMKQTINPWSGER